MGNHLGIFASRIQSLEASMAADRQALAIKEAMLNELRSLYAELSRENLSDTGGQENSAIQRQPERGSIAEAITATMREHGRAMRGRDLALVLKAKGVEPKSKTSLLALILSALRRRPDLFQKVGWGTYRLKEEMTTGKT